MLTTLQIDREGAVLRVRLRDVKIPVLCTSLKKKRREVSRLIDLLWLRWCLVPERDLADKGGEKKGDLRHDEQ